MIARMTQTCPLPFPRMWCIQSGRLLGGCYPADSDAQVADQKLTAVRGLWHTGWLGTDRADLRPAIALGSRRILPPAGDACSAPIRMMAFRIAERTLGHPDTGSP